MMMRNQKGFTLIELVMIIVILGILAAVAIPRYIDLQTEALDASFNGFCGTLKSTAAILIATSTGGIARGTKKDRVTIIASTDKDADVGFAASGTSYAITMTYKTSQRDCTLGSGLSSN